MRAYVENLLREATHRVLARVASDEIGRVPRVPLIPSKTPEQGDFASSVALALAGLLGQRPRDLAAQIVAEIRDPAGWVERTEIAGPGYINVFLSQERWHQLLVRILSNPRDFGRKTGEKPERVQVEFVSANPTGPLTIGHGRNAILGDVISRLLEATGHEVTREYYFNDAGRQMRVLAASLRARYEQQLGRDASLPEDGYQGEYLVDIARTLIAAHGETWISADMERFKEAAQEAIFADIRSTLERLCVHFDVYRNERALYREGRIDTTLEELRVKGLVYEAEGATWLRSSDLGLDRDRVLVKSSSEPTYLLPDIAYHREKLGRGFDLVIDILGPDHLEQFPYVKAATAELEAGADRIELVVYQWVNLRKGGELVKMSTRKASFVTIDEVLDEVGVDVFRYFMIERRADSHLDFDLDLARDRTERNPVFKIQYAHARLRSIERLADERGLQLGNPAAIPLDRLESPVEREICKRLEQYPEVIARAAGEREPQTVARYLLDLASAFHGYISDARRHRVLSEDQDLSRARLALVHAIRITLASGLGLLGIKAPERM